MTTACGSTTSSQGTPLTLSLEEAPFEKYLEILIKEGYESDAAISETYYVDFLTGFGYTKEQIMKTPFNKLLEAVEIILNQSAEEMKTNLNIPTVSGPMMQGKGADELTEDQLQYLLRRQLQLHEEEKLRQGM